MGTRILFVREFSLFHHEKQNKFISISISMLKSDVPDRSAGLQIELWERGQFWDKRLGFCHLRLDGKNDQYENGDERWIDLQLEKNSQRSSQNLPHRIFLRTFIEFPSDLTEEESKELTEKLQILHEILDKEVSIKSFPLELIDSSSHTEREKERKVIIIAMFD